MATTIASLNVVLNANTGKYQKKMTVAQRKAKAFKKAIGLATAAMGAFGLTIAGAAVIGGMRRFADEMDRMAKLSDRLGISLNSLGGLQFAAQISGTSAEQLSKSLEMMTRRLGESAQGLGEAKQAISILGLNLDSLISRSPDKAFLTIADAISKQGTAAQQAALANQFFGRSGVAMLNLIQRGSGGIKELTAEFSELRGGFADAARSAEEFNDAQTRLSVAWEGFITSGPALNNITIGIDFMTKSLVTAREEMQFLSDLLRTLSVQQAEDLQRGRRTASILEMQAEAQNKFNDAIADGNDKMGDAAKLLAKMQEEINLFGKKGFERQGLKLALSGGLSKIQTSEFVRLRKILDSLTSEAAEREKLRELPGANRIRGVFPLAPVVPKALGGDGASTSQFLATRAVDATSGNSISSELAGRQATEAERTRIQEKMLEEMKRNVEVNLRMFDLLNSRIQDDVDLIPS